MEYPRAGYLCIIRITIQPQKQEEKNRQNPMYENPMYELYEQTAENDDVREWAFFVVFRGEKPQLGQTPFSNGAWSLGSNDAEGRAAYEMGRQEAMLEVERLRRNAKSPYHR